MHNDAKIQITMLIYGESKAWPIIYHDSKLSTWEKNIDWGTKFILRLY